MQDVTAPLADYIVAVRPADLPDSVHREALRSFFNIVGCAIGGTLYCKVEHGIGSADRPMTDAELERNFTSLAEPVIGAARTYELIDRTWNTRSLADVGEPARAAA